MRRKNSHIDPEDLAFPEVRYVADYISTNDGEQLGDMLRARESALSAYIERGRTLQIALRKMILKWAPHSSLCCECVDGAIRVTRESCKCDEEIKEMRDIIGAWPHE